MWDHIRLDETSTLREAIRQFLNFEPVAMPVQYTVQERVSCAGYTRDRVVYANVDGDVIAAFLLIPEGVGPFPAILVHHQHASQRHLGKSEVVGLIGDPLQAFGPELVRLGFIVLAPDSVCFEDRRNHASGIQPHSEDDLRHYIEMGNRLIWGDSLMRKVLSDASVGRALLAHHPQVNAAKIGVMGHSYGGNTALFQGALETTIAFAVASGSLCSYEYKRQHDIALEMALIIPGFAAHWDLHHLLKCIFPRSMLVISAEDDPLSKDAVEVIARAKPNESHITHFRDHGGHSMTQERFDYILNFLAKCVS